MCLERILSMQSVAHAAIFQTLFIQVTSPSPTLDSKIRMACAYAGSNAHREPKGSGQPLENPGVDFTHLVGCLVAYLVGLSTLSSHLRSVLTGRAQLEAEMLRTVICLYLSSPCPGATATAGEVKALSLLYHLTTPSKGYPHPLPTPAPSPVPKETPTHTCQWVVRKHANTGDDRGLTAARQEPCSLK